MLTTKSNLKNQISNELLFNQKYSVQKFTDGIDLYRGVKGNVQEILEEYIEFLQKNLFFPAFFSSTTKENKAKSPKFSDGDGF